MSTPHRICAFYSKGPHYHSVLQYLRRQYPGAEITALVPAGYEPPDAVRALTTNLAETEQTAYSPIQIGACRRLVRQIRAARYDLFVVMFDSPQLRMLSALSKAKSRICLTTEGRRLDIETSPMHVIIEESLRLAKGHIVFAGVWLIVHLTCARPRLQFRRIARERLPRGK